MTVIPKDFCRAEELEKEDDDDFFKVCKMFCIPLQIVLALANIFATKSVKIGKKFYFKIGIRQDGHPEFKVLCYFSNKSDSKVSV